VRRQHLCTRTRTRCAHAAHAPRALPPSLTPSPRSRRPPLPPLATRVSFWFTQTGSGAEGEIAENWFSFQKPATSGNFNLSVLQSTGAPCAQGGAGGGRGGVFDIAADDETVPGRVPTVYLSSGDGTALLKLDTASGTTTVLALAPPGTIFRGISMAPLGQAPAPPSSNSDAGGAAAPNVAAGVLIPLFLLASCASGYAYVYHKAATMRALESAGAAGAALAETLAARVGGGSAALRRGEAVALMAKGVSPPRPRATSQAAEAPARIYSL
jgi:hypothetical protein